MVNVENNIDITEQSLSQTFFRIRWNKCLLVSINYKNIKLLSDVEVLEYNLKISKELMSWKI
jgi:hypothetical protein